VREAELFALPSLVALIVVTAAVASILFYYLRTGAPPVPARPTEIADVIALLREAALPDGARVYELGCGWGSLAVGLARAFPGLSIVGIELSPLPYLVSRLRALRHPNLGVRLADFLRSPLNDADAATCYLMIGPMPRLATWLDQQLRPGTPVVTLTFWFRERTPVATRGGPGLRGDAALYRWPGLPTASDSLTLSSPSMGDS